MCLFLVTEIRARAVLHTPKAAKAHVLHLTDGLQDGLSGIMLYCSRNDPKKELKMRTIADVRFRSFNCWSQAHPLHTLMLQ